MCSETVFDPTLLGSGQPPAATNLVLVVASTQFAYYVNLIISNTSSELVDSATVAIIPAGVSLNPDCYIAYEIPIQPNLLTVLANIGLGPQDQIVVKSQLGFLNFNATGNKFYNI